MSSRDDNAHERINMLSESLLALGDESRSNCNEIGQLRDRVAALEIRMPAHDQISMLRALGQLRDKTDALQADLAALRRALAHSFDVEAIHRRVLDLEQSDDQHRRITGHMADATEARLAALEREPPEHVARAVVAATAAVRELEALQAHADGRPPSTVEACANAAPRCDNCDSTGRARDDAGEWCTKCGRGIAVAGDR